MGEERSVRAARREPPNGARLSCGRNARQRKEVEPLIVPTGEATQFRLLVSARQLQALARRWPDGASAHGAS